VSKKHYCLIPHGWELGDLALHDCGDCSHLHLTRQQGIEDTSLNLVELLREPLVQHGRVRQRGVLRMKRVIPLRGLSAKVGEPLAMALSNPASRDWASTLLSLSGRRT